MKPPARKPHLSPVLPRFSVLAAIVWLAYPAVAVADVAGQFQFVFGDVRVLAADGKERPAQKGQSVAEGESVVTSASGSAQIKMIDGGTIAVRPGSQMKLDTYRFSGKTDGSERAAFSLLSGGLRAITGLIGKVNRQNYSIVTPTATIGIRGTDHEPTVVLPTSVGVEQRDPPGTYDRVNVGSTALTNSAGATLVNPNRVGFAGITGAPPVILPKIPNLYQAGPVPKPQSRAPEQEKKADSVASGTPASSSPSSTDPASATSDAGDKVTAVSTTSARSGSASGEDIRVVPTADTAVLSAPVVSAALVATPVAALVPVSVLTGKDVGGTSVNVTAQTVTSSAGSITTIAAASASTLVAPPSPIIIVEPTRTFSAPLHVSLGFDGFPTSTDISQYLGTSLSSAQTGLSAAATDYTTAVTAAKALASANTHAATALASAKTAFETARLAAPGNTTLGLISTALNSIELTAVNAASALDGGTSWPGTGVKQTLNLINQTVGAGNRLVAANQSAMSSPNFGNLQSANYSAQATRYATDSLQPQVNNPASSGQTAADSANNSVVQNVQLSNQAVIAASLLSPSTTGYLELQAAAKALQGAVTASNTAAIAARTAISDAQTAASVSKPIVTLGNQTNYSESYRYPQHHADTSRGLSFMRDALGNLSSIKSTSSTFDDDYGYYNFSYYGYGGTRSITPSSSTLLAGYGSDATTGLSWGRWQGGQVTTGHQYPGVDAQGVSGLGAYVNGVFVIGATYFEPRELGGSSLHWITGTANFPSYLPKILTGTADYRLVGGTTPTDSAGNVGALTAASLSVNFTTQRANASLGFSLSGYAWTVAATDLILQRGGQFASGSSGYCGNSCYTTVDIRKNNIVQSSVGTYGEIHGSLLGSGLSSAALYYSVSEFQTTPALLDPITGQSFQTTQRNMIHGVAGLAGPRQDEATPYRLVATAGAASDTYSNYAYSGGYGGGFHGGEMASSQLLDNASGLQAFASDNVSYLTSVSTNPTAPTAGFTDRATVKIGTAINRDVSSTSIDGTTIAWGRWEGGNIDIYSRDGSTKLGTVGNANASIHWLTSSPLMGELNTIPLTGVATYTLAGGTRPTDTKGNVGTLGAVTLNADFTNQKVDAAVKVNFASPSNTAAFSIISTGMPISSSGAFSSTRSNYLNNAQTTVSCVGASCGTITSGQLDGKFIGVAAKGAALTYGFNTTTPGTSIAPAVSNSVTGLVVMKR